MLKHSEYVVHTIALTIAIFGPLIKLLLGFNYVISPAGMYLYWIVCLSIYIVVLLPFTYKSPLTLIRLIILGITVEDFSSHVWSSLISGYNLLPFSNWYTQQFPFLGSLGEPTPTILIPRWYIITLFMYIILTLIQFRKSIRKFFLKNRPISFCY
jgi:hypothetical protein